MFKVKEILSDQYIKALNIISQNLNENYHVLFGLRLNEILFPVSDYGSEAFFRDFEKINGLVSPLIIYDLNMKKTVMVVGFEVIDGEEFLKSAGIDCLVVEGMKDLLTNTRLSEFYD